MITIDYRNARYQGHTNKESQKEFSGILIDDDLSFYASHWKNDMLNGATIVYISHGKYIYGQWMNNEPHGLNVFRTGDTVLLANYNKGVLEGKLLVIFQKYSVIAVLDTAKYSDEFHVVDCGKLTGKHDLKEFVSLLDVQVPDHYFSLVKFITDFTLKLAQNKGP